MVELSLVIPCYNEEKSLPELVSRARAAFAGKDAEIILVNNGSKDNSAEVMASLVPTDDPLLRVVTVEVNQGYGFGILSGLRQARGKYIGYTHADLQTDVADALRALRLADGADAVFVKGMRRGRPLVDAFFSYGMGAFESLLLGGIYYEINAQPTLFSRSLLDKLTDAPHDFSLDLYLYYKAKKAGYDMRRFSVFFPPRKHGESSWNRSWKDRVKFIKRVMAYSIELRRRLSAV